MKNKTLMKAISAFLAVTIVLCSAPLSGITGIELPDLFSVKAEAATYSGSCGKSSAFVKWTLDTETGELNIKTTSIAIGFMCEMEDYSSSDTAPWYSYRNSIKTVKITGKVKSIGNYAFYGCEVLKSVTISDSVTRIGNSAFSSCYSLSSITIPDSVKEIGSGAFYECYSLQSVIIPDSVTSLGAYAFERCENITSIILSDKLTVINNDAFRGCIKLGSIIIPDGVTSIESSAFYGCESLTSILIPDSVTSIGSYAFNYCKSLDSVIVPDGVETIENYAFSGCTGLVSVTIYDGITSISNGLFSGCESLTSIIIPDGVVRIGDYAFSGCIGLEFIVIPQGVTTIGSYSFGYCNSLTDVYYKGTEEEWNEILVNEAGNEYLANATIHFKGEVCEQHIPAPSVKENEISATCKSNGSYDMVVYCAVCDEELLREAIITTKINHEPDKAVAENIIDATCWSGGSYDSVVYCTLCGDELSREEVETPISHTPGEAVEENRVEASAVVPGSYDKVVYCSVCNAELSRVNKEIPALGHTPGVAVREKIIAATCASDGSYEEVVYCTCCTPKVELSREKKTIEKLPHTEVNFPGYGATCTMKGLTAGKKCSVCGVTTVEREVIPALGHTPGEAVEENRVEASATVPGSYDEVVYCSVCNTELSRENKEIPAHGHIPGMAVREKIIAATCASDGSYEEVVYCTCCTPKVELSREQKTLEKLPHTEVIIPGKAATCTETGLTAGKECTVCGEKTSTTPTEIPALGHTPGEEKEENRVEATEGIDGSYDLVVYCTVCNAEISRETIVVPSYSKTEANITTLLSKNSVKAGDVVTVTVKLTTNFYVSSFQIPVIFDKTQFEVVGEVKNKNYLTFSDMFAERNYTFGGRADQQKGIDATSNPDFWNTDEAKAKYGVARITASYSIAIGNNNETYAKPQDDVVATFQLKALTDVEDISESVFVSTDWTKTAENPQGDLLVGMVTTEDYYDEDKIYIKITNITYVTETAHRHTPATAVRENEVDADCENTGSVVLVVYCEECGEELSREEVEIPAFGHTEVIDKAVAPDCVNTGLTEGKHCSVCDKVFIAQEVVPELGHTDGEKVIEKNITPTCTEKGSYDSVIYCSVCKEELSRETVEVDIVPHDCKWIIDQEPTCTTEGYKHEKCKGCDFTRNENTVIEKLPHSTIRFDRVEPTCQLEGNIEYYFCSSCVKYYSDSECTSIATISQIVLGKTDHSYGEWIIGKEPDCINEGSRYRQCITCDDVIIENIAKIGHDYTENIVEATCVKSGFTQLECKTCGDNDIKDFVEPLGHKYIAVTTPPTSTQQGYTTYTCERCGDSYKEDFVNPSTGVIVSGTVKSFGNSTDVTTITLIKVGEDKPVYTTTVAGNSEAFCFNDVKSGNYIIKVTKGNHIAREYAVIIGEEDVSIDAQINLLGDMNGDGKINAIDVARANAHAKGASALSGYELACVDVIGDGRVNAIDVSFINAHSKGVKALW